MTDRLSEFGYTFQIKIITSLLKNKDFLQQIADILDPEYFENEANKLLVEIIKKSFFILVILTSPEAVSVDAFLLYKKVFASILIPSIKEVTVPFFAFVIFPFSEMIISETLNSKSLALAKLILSKAIYKNSKYKKLLFFINSN